MTVIEDEALEEVYNKLERIHIDKVYREDQQIDQHNINIDEVYAGHDRHAKVLIIKYTDKIADVHHRGPKARIAQEAPRRSVFLQGHNRQKDVCQRNQHRKINIEVGKRGVHTGDSPLHRVVVFS